MKEILFLEPVFKEMIWGGKRLEDDFGYHIPSDHTGECWAISAHTNGDCIIQSGTYKGKRLSELWDNNRELFGNQSGERFPLLIKIIDAKADLSIQVHPDDTYAKEHENGSYGKTECWYILDCDPDATIVIGHNAKDKDELRTMIGEERWNDLIREVPIKKGDFFQITPGTVHAIKGGTVILETQQNSDITYRLYDYNRLQDGKPRELHIDKSIDVIRCPHEENLGDRMNIKLNNGRNEKLVSCEFYQVNKIDLWGKEELTMEGSFLNVSVIEGEGAIDNVTIKKGDHFILPEGYGTYTLEGNMTLITSQI